MNQPTPEEQAVWRSARALRRGRGSLSFLSLWRLNGAPIVHHDTIVSLDTIILGSAA